MILSEIDPDTGINCVTETRLESVPDPVKRRCTCDMNRCLWYPLPRKPLGDLIHVMEAHDDQPWFPRHHHWEDGAPTALLCWKCGRALKGWRPKLTPFGEHVYVDKLPAVHFTMFDHFRAKKFQAYLPKLDETVQFDALHCADCELTAADGMQIVAIYLGGLLEAHLYGEALGRKLKLATTHDPNQVATYLARWVGVEPIGPVDRVPESNEPRWRS